MTIERTARMAARCIRLAAAAGCLLVARPSSAQTLTIVFVGPTATMTANFGPGVKGGYADGYRGVPLTAASEAAFQRVAPANLQRTYASLAAGTPLRRRIDDMLKVSGGVVDVEIDLVDDTGGLTGDYTYAGSSKNGSTYVWPAAWNEPVAGTNRYRAIIGLGTVMCDRIKTWPGGWLAWESTILHESMHTQFVGQKAKWGSVGIVYGGDAKHYFSELLGEQELTFEEGLGTFFGAVHNDPDGGKEVMDFFSRDDERYIIESRSVLAGIPEAWNAPHIEKDKPVPADLPPVGGYAWRYYKWKDVPATFVLFNEQTSTAFHLLFWQRANGDREQALAMVRASASAMWNDVHKRDVMYSANRLALQLEDFAATPLGARARTAGTLTSSMFPYALVDLLTHFGMTSDELKAAARRVNPDREPKGFTEYFAHRDAVKRLVAADLAASPIGITAAADKIHQYFRQAGTILSTGRP